jgi:GDP/UDP-N,N'-diacetylbacillosamine 2-epimerase (hydrolysing)
MKKRKICVVTGTRAEYGLMYWLLKEIESDPDLELQLIVTGMHLSAEFGLTYKIIEKDNFKISKKIEVILSSDSSVGISKSMGLAMISFSEAFNELNPDICVVLGDRFEIFSAVTAAMISKIPLAHIHGGERTEGAFDEGIRHSITKMSQLHFTAAEQYSNRVIQLGENPKCVFNFGAPGLDNISNLKLLNKSEFEKSINFKLGELNFLVTFHPVTLENNSAEKQFNELLSALSEFDNAKILFTLPNSDTNGRIIIKLIEDYVKLNSKKSLAITSLGQLRYLSALKHFSVVIGNSSSGLLEAPSLKIPTVNIGSRQDGRLKASSVIDCNPNFFDISKSIKVVLDEKFQKSLKNTINPYGSGGASKKIKETLKSYDLKNILIKKFYDFREK